MSFFRSECSTHIVRTHRDRLHSDCSTSFIDSFITDLNREASFIQSFKRRHALDSLCNLDSDKPDPSIVTSGNFGEVFSESKFGLICFTCMLLMFVLSITFTWLFTTVKEAIVFNPVFTNSV